MTVVAILGVLTSIVVLAIPDPRGALADEAEKLAARTSAVRDLAIMEARDTRLVVSPMGYSFERHQRGTWAALAEKPFRAETFSDGTSAAPVVVMFDTAGMADETQSITLARDGVRSSVLVDAGGRVRVGG